MNKQKYKVYLVQWWIKTITGDLTSFDNHIEIKDIHGKNHYYKNFNNIEPIWSPEFDDLP